MATCLLSFYQATFEKGSTLKGKNLLPFGSIFFPFKGNHIHMGVKIILRVVFFFFKPTEAGLQPVCTSS